MIDSRFIELESKSSPKETLEISSLKEYYKDQYDLHIQGVPIKSCQWLTGAADCWQLFSWKLCKFQHFSKGNKMK